MTTIKNYDVMIPAKDLEFLRNSSRQNVVYRNARKDTEKNVTPEKMSIYQNLDDVFQKVNACSWSSHFIKLMVKLSIVLFFFRSAMWSKNSKKTKQNKKQKKPDDC